MAGRISYLGGIVTQGLVLDLDAAKRDSYVGTGTAWNDISGNRNNGTLINGPTFNPGNGGSIVFDGTNDTVTTTSFNVDYITIHTWVKFNNFTNYNEIVGKWRDSDTNYSYTLLSNITNGAIRFWINTSTNTAVVNNGGTMLTGIWNCISSTFNGTTSSIYLNGTLIQSVSVSGIIKNSDVVVNIGNRISNNYPMNGNIAQTLIYNRALSSTEILQNYNATKGRYL